MKSLFNVDFSLCQLMKALLFFKTFNLQSIETAVSSYKHSFVLYHFELENEFVTQNCSHNLLTIKVVKLKQMLQLA